MSKSTINLIVSGMSSEHCAKTVKNLIIDERSVEAVEVFWEKGAVEVLGAMTMSRDSIVKSVNLSGKYHAK